ncbi:MAG: 6-carboxytetrahydropterin synthase [Bacteroidales bacterium]|nr:6-carboxytetrahydropterin synthase [Bacteroidales bacterium]
MLIRVTKEFAFEMAHALWGYDGKCRNIHGHTYRLLVTLKGEPINDVNSHKNGMVINFSLLKDIVNKEIISIFDHSLVLNANSPHSRLKDNDMSFDKIVLVPYQPTCENLLADFALRLQNQFSPNINLYSLKLYETITSYAEWFASDNK